VSRKYKRPTHESDAMKIFMSDSVAPEFLPLLQQYGDFAAAAIAYSAQRSPDFWDNLIRYTRYCLAMKEFLARLHREGRPLKREWLLKMKRTAAKFDDNVAAKPSLYLLNAIVGIKVWSIEIPEFTKEVIVDRIVEVGKHRYWERWFRLPVA